MNEHATDIDSLKRMEEILKQVETKGIKSLTSENLLEFGRLYRRVVAALADARSQGVSDTQITYLNQLASRAYAHLYVAESKPWPSVRRFFTREFPETFRRNLPFILVSFAICLVASIFAYVEVAHDPGKADTVLGAGAADMADSIAERHTGNKDWMPEELRPIMSSFIITNNVRVAILAFATGILLGLGTVIVLLYNGLMLGVISAVVNSRSSDVILSFWGFVTPHGVIELPAIFIAGGAGLMLGWALICPGDYTRGDALKLAARDASRLMLGVASMLVVAGLTEGLFSPSMIPNSMKLIVAGMLAVVEFTYLFTGGRKRSSESTAAG